jgi:uncharacterized protein (DUF1330 family)/SAM-dependent methyltransferase
MSVYALAQLTIRDRARHQAYVRRFPAVLERHGGRLLSADEAPRLLEGEWDRDKVVLLRFEDEAAFTAFANSPEYQEIARDRVAGAEGPVLLLRGLEPERPRYDSIGSGYARVRREDPELRRRIHAALGEARTVVNVGAGAGSYEPNDRYLIAVEPSAVMAAQRPPDRVPAVRGFADDLPLADGAVDAAMAILTLHHWDADQEAGVRELRRVARGPVVIVTYDPHVEQDMWLIRDYLPEVGEMDLRIFPPPERLTAWLGGSTEVTPLPVSRDTPDWTLGSFWAHPERVLDEQARAATSGFARMEPAVVERVVDAVRRDLADGTWDERNGALRELDAYDVGMRLVVSRA